MPDHYISIKLAWDKNLKTTNQKHTNKQVTIGQRYTKLNNTRMSIFYHLTKR